MAKYKKRPDGRYYTLIDIGHDETGKRLRKGFYAPTIRELEAKISDFKSLMNKGIIITDSNTTLAEWAEKWLHAYRRGGAYNTQEHYRLSVEKHIIPHPIAQIPMGKIKPIDLQSMVNDVLADGHIRTAQILVMTLKQVFAQAVDNEIIYADPAAHLKKPTYKAPQKRPLTDAENKAIDKADLSPKERAFVYLGKYAGLRRGEILALSKRDFNLKKGTLDINKAVVFQKNTGVIKPMPKSEAGFRTIEMPDILKTFICDYLVTIDTALFLTEAGCVCSRQSFRKMWESIIDKLNTAAGSTDKIKAIIGLTPHILRHDYATSLYYAGVDIKKAQYLLGHSDIKMTLEIYTHLDMQSSSAAKKLNKHYGSQMVVNIKKSAGKKKSEQ